MSESARIHTWGCDKHQEDTYEGCYSCDLADSIEMGSTITGMRTAFRQIKTWIALHRAGELSVGATLEQIERDADRCLPNTSGAPHD